MADIPIVMVVAVARNGVIGREGDMPWKLSTDLKRFKALTMGKPLLLGRKTFESFGSRPLPGRPHVIISRTASYDLPGVQTVRDLSSGLELAKRLAADSGADEICIIGGGEIYRQAFDQADLLHVTHVEADIAGDTYFPQIDPSLFEKVEESAVPAGEKDNYPTRYAVYRRRTAS
ncbi:dihydrofolate reductase [Peteryoungia desertarenae]|uniref:Dihydrofolate reductase n=1 Tax=Peteryoungia desertarenae TaxID=1813451 RepID=A0ABX6QRI4_9HYPH|nr:dihydrofolate reductase [Peteryoungia desertarenae]QLF70800.1 dihydrofolate reductase [Peteryoungia desertarenae]